MFKTAFRSCLTITFLAVLLVGEAHAGPPPSSSQVCFVVEAASAAPLPAGPIESVWPDLDISSVDDRFPAPAAFYMVDIQGGIATGIGSSTVALDANGCFDIVGAVAPGPFRFTVHSHTRDPSGNEFYAVNAQDDTSAPMPERDLTYDMDGVRLNGALTVLSIDGIFDDRWSGFAMGAYAFHDIGARIGLTDSSMQMQFQDVSTNGLDACARSSAWYLNSRTQVVSDAFHPIVVGRCYGRTSTGLGNSGDSRDKFVIGHEVAHGITRLRSGTNGGILWENSVYFHPNFPPAPTGCGPDGPGYGFTSPEYDSLAIREGWADALAAMVWNSPPIVGPRFRLRTFEAPTAEWNAGVAGANPGGMIANAGGCQLAGAQTEDGISTRGDWFRFWWDLLTFQGCASNSTMNDLAQLYIATRQEGRDVNDVVNGERSYHDYLFAAAQAVPFFGNSLCWSLQLSAAADYNCIGGEKIDGTSDCLN